MVKACLFDMDIITMYIVKSHCIVTQYQGLLFVLGNGPTVSIDMTSLLSTAIAMTNRRAAGNRASTNTTVVKYTVPLR